MNFFKKLFIVKLCCQLALVPILVYSVPGIAQTVVDASTQNMNRAMSGIIQNAMQSRGYVPSDPRTYNTLARTSGVIATVAGGAAAVTVGAVTAPGWATFALAMGVGSVISYAVGLGLDTLVKWFFRPDGKIDQSSDTTVVSSNCTLAIGGSYWASSPMVGGVTKLFAGCDGVAVASEAYKYYITDKPYNDKNPPCSISANSVTCGLTAYHLTTGAPMNCPLGTYSNGTQCLGFTAEVTPVPAASAISPQTAINNLSSADLDKKLNPAIIAALANRAWQQAASQPGYDGLPYPMAKPVTAGEASTWLQSNPTFAPTVRDFVGPNPTTTTSPVPWALPSDPVASVTSPTTQPNPNATNPGSQNPVTNLGADPATPAPQLEPIPTAPQILNPILNMLPGHSHFVAVGHTGQCPTPTFTLYGSHTLDAHCTLIDQNKGVIQGAMMFSWTVIALFIVLSA